MGAAIPRPPEGATYTCLPAAAACYMRAQIRTQLRGTYSTSLLAPCACSLSLVRWLVRWQGPAIPCFRTNSLQSAPPQAPCHGRPDGAPGALARGTRRPCLGALVPSSACSACGRRPRPAGEWAGSYACMHGGTCSASRYMLQWLWVVAMRVCMAAPVVLAGTCCSGCRW